MKKWLTISLGLLLPIMAVTLIIQSYRAPETVESIARGFSLICELFLKAAGL